MLTYEHQSLRQGLVGAWCPSLGASGRLLIDRSGRGINPEWTGTGFSYSSAGVSMSAASNFAASALPVLFDFDTTSTFSFSAWINYSGAVEKTIGTFGPFEFLIGGDNSFRVGFGPVFPSNYLRPACAVTAGVTSHLAVVYTGTKTVAGTQFFVNGTRVTSVGIDSLSAATVFGSGVRFFNRAGNTNQFTGTADDLRFYNRALTLSEIRLLASRRGIGLVPLPDRAAGLPRKLSVNVGGDWRPADAYVNVGAGEWKLAQANINVAGTWK
jgi:hypothetical protein